MRTVLVAKMHEIVLPDGRKLSGEIRQHDGLEILVIHKDQTERWYIKHPQTGELTEIDPEQQWFWTSEWQAKETEVDKDLEKGLYEDFDDFDEFINTL